MSEQAVLRCEALTRTYGSGATEVKALVDAELAIEPGELVILRGPSGSGKTTLLNLLGGLDVPTSGHVWLGDREVTGASERDLVDMRRREIGYIFQTFALLSALSAAENVELPMRMIGMPVAERRERVAELLAVVGLAEHAEQRPNELSGGQQQRLGIARALANSPRLIIADEPTGQLDSLTSGAATDGTRPEPSRSESDRPGSRPLSGRVLGSIATARAARRARRTGSAGGSARWTAAAP